MDDLKIYSVNSDRQIKQSYNSKGDTKMRRYLFLTVTLVLFFSLAVNAFATTYYVKNGGNDGNTGLSDAQAWATVSKVNSSVSGTGDDVYFKCGGTWTENTYLKIDWSGTIDNRIVVGAYYGDGIVGVSGNKPIIDGGTHSTSTLPENPTGGTNYGLVHIGYRDYVSVENLSIKDSRGLGIYYDYSNYGIIENCDVGWIRSSGLMFNHSTHGQIIGCTAHNVGTGHKYFGDSNWGFSMGGINLATNMIVRESTISECWCEGIGVYKKSDNSLVENNIVYGAQKVGIYIEQAKNNIIRNNLVYGISDASFHRFDDACGSGLYIADENWPTEGWYSENNKWYGNLVAYCVSGLQGNGQVLKNSLLLKYK